MPPLTSLNGEEGGYNAGMPEITVFPHGDRWAVTERGAQSLSKEFLSREAAELATRHMATGGAAEALDEDPTGLAHVEPGDAGRGDRPGTEPPQPAGVPESTRAAQSGL